jgi:hypothetical protein
MAKNLTNKLSLGINVNKSKATKCYEREIKINYHLNEPSLAKYRK